MFARADLNAELFAYGRDVSRVTSLRRTQCGWRRCCTISASTVGRRTAGLPRWVSYLGYLIALVVLLVAAANQQWTQLVFPSVGPARERGDPRRSPAEPCPHSKSGLPTAPQTRHQERGWLGNWVNPGSGCFTQDARRVQRKRTGVNPVFGSGRGGVVCSVEPPRSARAAGNGGRDPAAR